MKAITKTRPVDGDWPVGLSVEDRPLPDPVETSEVLVRVQAAGICGTDVGIYGAKNSIRVEMAKARKSKVIIGHEFGGVVEAAGPAALEHLATLAGPFQARDDATLQFFGGRPPSVVATDPGFTGFLHDNYYVSAEMHVTCGTCLQCRMGDFHVCRNTVIRGVHDDGAFAEFVKLPVRNIVLFPKAELPIEIIAFMDALGNAVHTVESARVEGKNILVLGCGVQGLMAVAAARRSGAARIFVTDVSQESRGIPHERLAATRFAMARRFGASACFDMADSRDRDALTSDVMAATADTGVDAALEMSGSYAAYRNALDLLRMGGTLSLLGIPAGQMSLDFAHDVIFRGITIHGIIGRRMFQTWETMRRLLSEGLANELISSGFVSHRYPLEQIEEGIQQILLGNALKVVLRP